MKKYEGSKADMRQDRAGAKKAGSSLKQYERSAQDRKEDARGQAKFNAAARKGRGR
jgi:hypothetical protein